MNELALFAGAGGGILGTRLLGWRVVCAVEIDPYCREVLFRRQEEGITEPFAVWDDVRTFDGCAWRGRVDVATAGFPCQDISAAGKGAGLDGERSGLWGETIRIIREARPRYALLENSPMLTSRGLGRVLADLAESGYNARWRMLSAAELGAPITRNRIWIIASASENDGDGFSRRTDPGKRNMGKHQPARSPLDRYVEALEKSGKQWQVRRKGDCPPYLMRICDAMANELDRLRALGNGQVPAVVAAAWRLLGGE